MLFGPRGDVLPETRTVAAITPIVLIMAFAVLYLFPNDDGSRISYYTTAQEFAWPVRPQIVAMTLGATYAGGALFFYFLLFARYWKRIGHGLIPIAVFNWAMMIATITNWNDFTHDQPAFLVWTVLYFTLPIAVPVLWIRNYRASIPVPRVAGELMVPIAVRVLSMFVGMLLGLLALILFAFPNLLANEWPWELSSLTSRILGAQIGLIGGFFIVLAFQNRWEIGRHYIRPFLILPLVYLGAIVSSWHDMADGTATWAFVAIGVALLVVFVPGLYGIMESRRRLMRTEAAG